MTIKESSSPKELTQRFTPFEKPVNPIKAPVFDLTPEQQDKYDKVLAHFTSLDGIAMNEEAPAKSPITDAEKSWLTKEQFLRYLRATKWNVTNAIKRIEETMIWRRSFGCSGTETDLLTAELISEENETGKMFIFGYDNDNRPCLYLRNGYQNTKPSIKQVQHLVFMLEKVITFMPPGQDTLALLIDNKPPDSKFVSSKFPPLGITKQCLHILQYHYPERLGKGLFTNLNWLFWGFLKLSGPFIDPYTRSKTVYDVPFVDYVPAEQLDKEFNGSADFQYKHEQYWPTMLKMAEERHRTYVRNFERLGGKIGLSEYDLRLPLED
ncbi:hypothetical protein BABINDRAFT_165145 [Babjeviella inositovora NRRL Y-12698]|uniref:CRAL-TRIO domain-containing protein n=1 Tax=Babjeviella inositovora NRRL Y-12698 TaxID=984486 RepID=A0A1E3QVB8_9ASCO|nr:uncharacterized protein BABINDRAFT_165145 [Babjeviella inositovora NRRL Y-12698]ODQ81606.1 hypothetical protein BABINDRAFT_165145 [Babjeviella inositovora NRRL Y-12698]